MIWRNFSPFMSTQLLLNDPAGGDFQLMTALFAARYVLVRCFRGASSSGDRRHLVTRQSAGCGRGHDDVSPVACPRQARRPEKGKVSYLLGVEQAAALHAAKVCCGALFTPENLHVGRRCPGGSGRGAVESSYQLACCVAKPSQNRIKSLARLSLFQTVCCSRPMLSCRLLPLCCPPHRMNRAPGPRESRTRPWHKQWRQSYYPSTSEGIGMGL